MPSSPSRTKPVPVRIPAEMVARIDALKNELVPREAYVRHLLEKALNAEPHYGHGGWATMVNWDQHPDVAVIVNRKGVTLVLHSTDDGGCRATCVRPDVTVSQGTGPTERAARDGALAKGGA